MMRPDAREITIDGALYVAIPKAEYERLFAEVDARRELGDYLRAAREHAGLSQVALAKKLQRARPTVCMAEAGKNVVGTKYVQRVLEACGLPSDWRSP